MKQELTYALDIQLFGNDNEPNVEVEETVETAPVINLDKLDDKKVEKGDKEKDLAKELEELRRERDSAIEDKNRYKDRLDKSRSEIAKNNKNLREVKSTLEQEDEEKAQLRNKLKEFELAQKKTDLLYSFTEELGITKDASSEIVSAIYFEETSEVSVPDLQMALSTVFKSVRDESYKRGYETRDNELASGKPRSIGNNKSESIAEKKKREYKEKNARR